jgi:hypothetical protein
MDILFAFFSGVISKLYDDIYDNKIIENKKINDILKGLNWILFTLVCYNDFNFALVFYVINIFCLLKDPEPYLKESYEFSLVFLFPLLILLNFSSLKYFGILDLFYVMFFSVVMIFEPVFFKEEYSSKKFIMRSISFISSVSGLLIGKVFNISTSLVKISGYATGYALVSSIFQLYMLSQNNDRIFQTMVLHR